MLSQYCRLSFCREGTAWLLRPACVRFLSNMFLQKLGVSITFMYNISASTTRGAGVQMERYVEIWYHRGKYKKIIDSTGNLDDIGKETCIIDHSDLEMTTKHEGGGRGQKAWESTQRWSAVVSGRLFSFDCSWRSFLGVKVNFIVYDEHIHHGCFRVNC